MTRTEYERLPKRPDDMWLKEMQDAANELKEFYSNINSDRMSDKEMENVADRVMEELTKKATQSMKILKQWNDLTFLTFTFWACIEEMEKWHSFTHVEVQNERERELRAEAMLRTQVLTAWLMALKMRIEELGGTSQICGNQVK